MDVKTCVVVGYGPGNGQGVARAFGAAGFRLGLIARTPAKQEAAAAELRAAGYDCELFAGDAGDEASLTSAVAAAAAKLGGPEVLVYNAAAFRQAPPSALAAADLVADFRTNVAGALVAANAVLPGMKARGSGAVLFTGGGWALYPDAPVCSTAIGKAGLRHLALMLQQELTGTGVRAGTGASGGIGEAVARDLRKAGANLVLTARSADKLDRLAAELGGTACVPGEVTDPGLPDRLLRTALDRFGRADVLVNNAGLMHVGTVEAVDLDKVTQMVRVNVEALFRATYVFLRHFKPRKSGFVVNVSSVAGLKTGARQAAYNGTKFAVEAYTDALRVELAGSGVGMAAVAPGTVDTNLYAGWDKADRDYIHSGGALRPADVARCVRFVLEQPPHALVPRVLVVPAAQPV